MKKYLVFLGCLFFIQPGSLVCGLNVNRTVGAKTSQTILGGLSLGSANAKIKTYIARATDDIAAAKASVTQIQNIFATNPCASSMGTFSFAPFFQINKLYL
ncbi:hypothetical protein A3J41_01365 [candidate division TM6 bacterium RIFCSPHIGHO2_12_FULL_38_8]|nr:MAG: hypothetical protein A3J41_01365 [candidate division TM6 bacterium RIFCSPHIGHO2_12_FULL_38_8]